MVARSVETRLFTAGRIFLVLGFVVLVEAVHAAPSGPNVLLIVADDLGYSDVGFQGSRDIRTPNIDALAASGIVMQQGYSSASLCSPSRAGYMTGRYQQRFGHENNIPGVTQDSNIDPNIGLPVDQVTLGDMFKSAATPPAQSESGTSAPRRSITRTPEVSTTSLAPSQPLVPISTQSPPA